MRNSRNSEISFRQITGRAILACGIALGAASSAQAITDPADLTTVAGLAEHCDDAVASGDYVATFECGDEFFETQFNAVDGGGANVGEGLRYTRVPRADLTGPGEWASHVPARITGPNGSSCNGCHNFPVGTAAGTAASNVARDPEHTGNTGQMITRNTPILMGAGGLQLLAEEMNVELEAIVAEAEAEACEPGVGRRGITKDLVSKGVDFGTVRVRRCGSAPRIRADGVDRDLVVRPFQWKGVDTMRTFTRGAMHNELGIQSVELVGENVDGDGDGVVNEASIADMTATAIYMDGQARPATNVELDALRLMLEAQPAPGPALAVELGLPTLTGADFAAIARGEEVFGELACGDCHRSQLTVDNPVIQEPSANPNYRDATFPGGQPGIPLDEAISFDITTDMLDNHIVAGAVNVNLANFEIDNQGRAIVALFGDLKRHDMGPGLAENIDDAGIDAQVWLTKELWGVGSTAPYLHDGRATTIEEAIREHGGEAAAHAAGFDAASLADQTALTAFLQNLVIFKAPEE
jgi:hypothetical protein